MAQDIVGKVGEILHAYKHIERDELQPGQHIFVYRAVGSYTHHGIYVGKDNQGVQYVIHFLNNTGWNLLIKNSLGLFEPPPCRSCGHRKGKDVGIVKTCLDCFMKKGDPLAGTIIYLYDYSKTVTYPLEEVVQRAYKKLQKKNTKEGFGTYNLIVHNCEDFATYCSIGSEKSVQVESVAKSTFGMGALIVATSTALLVYRQLR